MLAEAAWCLNFRATPAQAQSRLNSSSQQILHRFVPVACFALVASRVLKIFTFSPQREFRVKSAANKAFQPTRLRRASEGGVMRPNQVGHFCRIVSSCGWLGFASLSKAGEIVRCYLSLVLCIASRRFSSLSSCQNGWFKVGTCNACSGICANLLVHTRSAG